MKKLSIFLILLAIIGGGLYLFYTEGTLPMNKADVSAKKFEVKPGVPLDTIINDLAKEGLIRNRLVFYLVVKQKGIERSIQAGEFTLSPSMNAFELAEALTHGTQDEWVVIREGLRKEEIAEIISKAFNVTETEFNQIAEEGYLFPDTYLIPKTATAQEIVTILKNNYEEKYTPEMRAKAKRLGLTDEEVLIIASMVEREARNSEERQEVASIIVKRYKNDWPMNIDATIQYALGYQPKEKKWWKTSLTLEDLKLDSPYNTYTNTGLPPGPISNPGIAVIDAVVNANPNTPYWFYLTDPSGKTHYSKTNDEHERKVDKYLR